MNGQTSSVSNNHVLLQLLSSSFERVIKILLLLKDKHLTGNYHELQKAKDKFNKYINGHGIDKTELSTANATIQKAAGRVPKTVLWLMEH